jgi:hypothetical protein
MSLMPTFVFRQHFAKQMEMLGMHPTRKPKSRQMDFKSVPTMDPIMFLLFKGSKFLRELPKMATFRAK